MDDRFEIRPYRSEDEAQVVFLVRELQAHESQLFDHMAPPAGIYALVGDLIVTQAARGQGIGTALVAECERLARQAGEKWLRVTVLAANRRAGELYRRHGFAQQLIDMEKALT